MMASDLNLLFFMYMVGGISMLPLAAVLVHPAVRVKLKRQLLKRNYGYVILRSRGRNLTTFVRNLDAGTITIRKARWVITPESIQRYEDNKFIDLSPLTEQSLVYKAGIPTVFLDIDDVVPLELVNRTIKDQAVSRNPLHLEALMSKEVSAAEMEALKRGSDKLRKLLIITLILALAAAALSGIAVFMVNDTGKAVQSIVPQINDIHGNMTAFQYLSVPPAGGGSQPVIVPHS